MNNEFYRQFDLLKKKDPRAVKYFYNMYFPIVYRKISSMVREKPVVEELIQDVFIRLGQSADTLEGPQTLAAFLYITARNTVCSYFRTKQVRDAREEAIIR